MAAQAGQDGIWNNMPCTVYSTKIVAGVQYDTIIIDNPVMRVVPDSQVTTTAPAPAVNPADVHPAAAPKGKQS